MTSTYEDPTITSWNDAFRVEAQRVRKKSSLNDAFISSPQRQSINNVQAMFNNAVKQIKRDPNLTDRGKQIMLARVYTEARRRIMPLEKADRESHIKRYDEVEKSVFGSTADDPASVMSFRNACDRAAELQDAPSALRALDTAQRGNDATLARAIVMRAWQAGWSNVTDTYAATNPKLTDQLAELAALRHHLDSTVSVIGGDMITSLRRPAELEMVNADQLAEEDLPLTQGDILLGRTNGTITPQQEKDFREQAVADARDYE